MNSYKIADLIVEMDCLGELLHNQLKSYRTDIDSSSDIKIDNNYENLKKAKEKYPELTLNELEYIKTGFDFSSALLDFDGFCLHSSALAMDNKAILFSAPCGTGKSTQARLWQEYFGVDNAEILNDDKPALRLIDGVFHVYGTPWSGKSFLNLNKKVPLKAIVFIEQAENNHIKRLNSKEAVQMMIYQSIRLNNDSNKIIKFLTLLDIMIKKIAVYQMGCTISTEAVKLVHNEIFVKAERRKEE